MVKGGYGSGFARKSIAELGGRGFYRNIAIEPRISGALDLAHTTLAEQRKDLVRTETVTCGKRHVVVQLEATPVKGRNATSVHLMELFRRLREPSSSTLAGRS
jgi:hypothetical protein